MYVYSRLSLACIQSSFVFIPSRPIAFFVVPSHTCMQLSFLFISVMNRHSDFLAVEYEKIYQAS